MLQNIPYEILFSLLNQFRTQIMPFKVITLALLITLSNTLFAEGDSSLVDDIETIISKNCLKSYKEKYLKRKDHKAFAYARGIDGRQTCSWNYKSASVEKASESALANCAKRTKKNKITTKCQLIAQDSKLVIKKSTFPALVKPDYKALTDKEYFVLHEQAMPVLGGKYCQKIFRKYLNLKGHKAFTYTTSKEGAYSVCTYKNLEIPNKAEELALAVCQKNKMKNPYSKTLTPDCKVFATNNTIKLTREDFGIPPFELTLISAAERMHLDTVKKLHKEGANIEMKNEKGHTPLISAIRNRRLDVVKYLVEEGADINAPSKYGRLPLKFAIVAKKNNEVIKYLKSKGAKEKH